MSKETHSAHAVAVIIIFTVIIKMLIMIRVLASPKSAAQDHDGVFTFLQLRKLLQFGYLFKGGEAIAIPR